MSYRELRNFAEHMRALGYQRLVSVENFRVPNFELVASVLYWMVKRYDPEINLSDCIETEDDRVEFITNVVTALATKARIKLNAKRLYAADGRAVRELLKLASVLFQANCAVAHLNLPGEAQVKVKDSEAKNEDIVKHNQEEQPLSSRVKEIKQARALATEITDIGARLHDLLSREKQIKNERNAVLMFLENAVSSVNSSSANSKEHRRLEKDINNILSIVAEDIETNKKQCEELEADERALETKIKKKQAEVERHDKRLRSLQTVRPAFMDEYERLERELEKQYAFYLERFRNLDYLQHELNAYDKAEDEKIKQAQEQIDRLRKKEIENERDALRGAFCDDDNLENTAPLSSSEKKK
mmetsp:Transcript_6453/g.7676  ORF Transcript_6453/g.7676 Transcript_6453/m.7676 type:complete len:358 (-) Transcript_6453:590-1663(-)